MISPTSTAELQRLQRSPGARVDSAFRTVHMVGICGSGMKALAELLTGMGCRVTGSDLQPTDAVRRTLQQKGLRIHSGHNSEFLSRDADVLVYSPAIGPSNPERVMAGRFHIPQLSFSQALGLLMRDRIGVCVAGTHGKSTTTALIAFILDRAGRAASSIVGAELCEHGKSGWYGDGDLFVVESCEYQRSFLDLRPTYALILDIEPDHFDYFEDFKDTKRAFNEFAESVSPVGRLLVRGDCSAAVDAGRRAPSDCQTFSLNPGADWWGADLRQTPDGTRFRVFFRGNYVTEICVPLRGPHNVLNALAAVAMCDTLGVPTATVREIIPEFRGIRRRFEQVGSYRGIALVDDYAHHPTAVKATLQSARERFGSRRLWCIFQPHQVSRTTALLQEFAGSFLAADEILIAPTFAAREAPDARAETCSQELAERIVCLGGRARYRSSLDRIIATLEDESRPGDVWITMGAGDINRVHHEFTRRLQRNHSTR